VAFAALITSLGAARAQDLDPLLERVAVGAPWPRQPLLDTARSAARVDVAWPSTPALGEGASVCVIDTGVDLFHPTFRDTTGRTRVRFLLDVSELPRGDHPDLERGGGAVFDAAAIDAALSSGEHFPWTGDWHAHGTAIAAAAVGDDAGLGADVPGPYAGVAPRASLIVVRALRRGVGGLLDEDLIRGARFCAEVMDPSRGVMLLALGGHDGAHDGSEPLELRLAEHVASGFVLVAAAGNDGNARLHAGGTTSAGVRTSIELVIPAPERDEARVVIAVRTASSVGVVGPNEVRALRSIPRGEEGSAPGVRIDARSPRATYVVLEGDAALPLVGGTYRIEVGGDFDAWITAQNLGSGFDRPSFSGRFAREAETVAIPATHPALIAVGAFVSRAAWPSETGGDGLLLDGEPGTLRAPFSALGPSSAGAHRPDLLAPGALVRSALSSSMETGIEALFSDDAELERYRRGEGVVLAGTSIAAALVAGAIALARAEVPEMEPEVERAALISSASAEGHLDVAAYLTERARPGGTRASNTSLSLSRSSIRPGTASLEALVLTRDAMGNPLDGVVLSLFTSDDVPLGSGVVHRGLMRLALPALSGDVGSEVTIQVRTDREVLATASVRLSMDERGHAVNVSGCAARRSTGAFSCVLVLAACALLRVRRRR
jgi:subtilisin family serine protease